MPTPEGLQIEGLYAGYGKATVLHGLDLVVKPGEIVGVAGPNGAGKTTLLRAISGTVSRSARTLCFEGVSLKRDPVRSVAQGIVHVPEGRRLFADLTADENLKIGAIGANVQDYDSARARLVAMLPAIEPMLPRKAGLLSGGQQQLVAVARGLIGSPRIILFDELSLGLSPTAVASVTQVAINSCRELGTSVLWVDQNVTILSKLCDRLVLLRAGVAVDIDLTDKTALNSVYF